MVLWSFAFFILVCLVCVVNLLSGADAAQPGVAVPFAEAVARACGPSFAESPKR